MSLANVIVTNLVAFAMKAVAGDLRTRQRKTFFQNAINVKALKTTKKESDRTGTKKYAALYLLGNHLVFLNLIINIIIFSRLICRMLDLGRGQIQTW